MVLGMIGLGLGSTYLRASAPIGASQLVLTSALGLAIVLSYWFPIHVRLNTKIYLGSAVLYVVMVVLVPVPAAILAGLGVAAGELSVRARHGNRPRESLFAGARWALLALCGSLVAHAPVSAGEARALPLAAAALLVGGGDLVLSAAVYAAHTHERIGRILPAMIRQGGAAEAAQYVIGLIAVLEVPEHPWTLGLFVVPVALVYATFRHAQEVRDDTQVMLESMADAVDLRDPYTGGHSRRVTELVADILHELNKHGPEADLILSAARVHDIGKIAVPDAILLKPGPLSADERAVMGTHPVRGAELLRRYEDFARGVDIVRHHHEAWDGSGYPDGLVGTDIPFGARVIAVADSYDAMTSDRPYRLGMTSERALEILREGRDRQWDAVIVDAFLRSMFTRQAEAEGVRLLVLPKGPEAGSRRIG